MKSNSNINLTTLSVDNLKCGGCETTIRRLLLGIDGIEKVQVNASFGSIAIDSSDPLKIEEAFKVLSKAGYPPAGKSNIKDVAKSYLSCLKGQISK